MFLVNFFKNLKPINKSLPNEDFTVKSSQKTESITNISISNSENNDQLRKRFLLEEEPRKLDEKLIEIDLNESLDQLEKKSLRKTNFHKKLNPLDKKSKLPSIKKRTNSVLHNVSEINASHNSPVGISEFKDLSSIKYEYNKENKNMVKIKEKKKRKKNKIKVKNVEKRDKSDSIIKIKDHSLNKIGVAKCHQKNNNTLISIEEEKNLKNSTIFDNIDKILAKSTAYIKKNRESYEKDLIRLFAQNAKLDNNIYFKKIIDDSENNGRKNYFAMKNISVKKSAAKRLDKSVEHSQNRKKK